MQKGYCAVYRDVVQYALLTPNRAFGANKTKGKIKLYEQNQWQTQP